MLPGDTFSDWPIAEGAENNKGRKGRNTGRKKEREKTEGKRKLAFHEPQRLLRRVCCHDPPCSGSVSRGAARAAVISGFHHLGASPSLRCLRRKQAGQTARTREQHEERERKREEKWRRERRKASKGTFCNRLLSLPLFPFFVSLPPPAMDSDYPHWILYPRASPSRGYLCTLRYINKSWKFIYRIIATRWIRIRSKVEKVFRFGGG